jgi:hypothetical protein
MLTSSDRPGWTVAGVRAEMDRLVAAIAEIQRRLLENEERIADLEVACGDRRAGGKKKLGGK